MGDSFPRYRLAGIVASLLLAFVMVLVMVHTLVANPLAANLDGSTKSVDRNEASPGQEVQYTIVISNSGDTQATAVDMTDTLPISATYQSGSLQTDVANAFTIGSGENNGVITWTGSLGEQGFATITFQALLTETLLAGNKVTNTVVITGAGSLITRTAFTSIITNTEVYLPIIYKAPPVPTLNAVSRPNSNNEWTVSWSDVGSEITNYQLQEDADANFPAPVTYDAGASLSRDFTHAASAGNYYCYRVRAEVNGFAGGWSNVQCVVGNYYDAFSDNTTGWDIRRQDTDNVDNKAYYQNGSFVVEVDGRWDYAIAAPMRPAPAAPYRIQTSVRLNEPDNLNSFGIIFGGDWNGSECPNASYSSCFNHYYRLQIIWYGAPDTLRLQLKRIDYHSSKNEGRGVTLIPYRDVTVGSPTEDWKVWQVDVSETGNIKIYVNNTLVAEANDSTYINDPYFGVFAATDEYLGAEPWHDWYRVDATD